jgi:hypothetical protein
LGKQQYIDWTPSPYDAGDAIRWLERWSLPDEAKAMLITALWKFLPRAPAQDLDGIRLELCRLLLEQGHPQQAAGIAAMIEDQLMLAHARLMLLGGQWQ